MTIIDTHTHIDQLEDLSGALERATAAGLSDIVAMSVDLSSMKSVLDIARNHQQPRIHPALGIHPGKVNEPDHLQAVEFLKQHILDVTIIGETGLDYWYKWVRSNEIERGKQKDSFAIHLDLAKTHDLPIVIHARGAWRDCLAMTKAAGVRRALFHWYSGPLDIQEQIISAGYYVSTSPSVAYSPESRKAMAQAPINRILIETDSPVRYRINTEDSENMFLSEPKDVICTLKALALLKGIDELAVLNQVNQNAREFFALK